MIYLISGLGANEKIFTRLNLQGRPFTFLPWIKPKRKESFDRYLDRFSKEINPNEEIILIGTSFGGMVSQELSKRFNVKKIILISSIVSEKEFSPLIRFFRITGLYKLVPPELLLKFRFLFYYIFGSKSGKEKKFLRELLDQADADIIRWSIHTAINWKHVFPSPPGNIYRIHGTKDIVFPHRYIGKAHLVQNGSHLMIVKNATAINTWLSEILNE
jgi:pimeloyl-ACP methyl ester carboxylesterase